MRVAWKSTSGNDHICPEHPSKMLACENIRRLWPSSNRNSQPVREAAAWERREGGERQKQPEPDRSSCIRESPTPEVAHTPMSRAFEQVVVSPAVGRNGPKPRLPQQSTPDQTAPTTGLSSQLCRVEVQDQGAGS